MGTKAYEMILDRYIRGFCSRCGHSDWLKDGLCFDCYSKKNFWLTILVYGSAIILVTLAIELVLILIR